jgi:hypothetical protein
MQYALFSLGLVLSIPWAICLFVPFSPTQKSAKFRMEHPVLRNTAQTILMISFISLWVWGFMHYSWWVVVLSTFGAIVASVPVGGMLLSKIPGGGWFIPDVGMSFCAIALWIMEL